MEWWLSIVDHAGRLILAALGLFKHRHGITQALFVSVRRHYRALSSHCSHILYTFNKLAFLALHSFVDLGRRYSHLKLAICLSQARSRWARLLRLIVIVKDSFAGLEFTWRCYLEWSKAITSRTQVLLIVDASLMAVLFDWTNHDLAGLLERVF